MQLDNVNCGSYVMFYMKCKGQEKSCMYESFNANIFRSEITDELLSFSENMDDMCFVCLNTTLPNTNLKCIKWDRWIRSRCLKQSIRVSDKKYEEISVISYDNTCIFC